MQARKKILRAEANAQQHGRRISIEEAFEGARDLAQALKVGPSMEVCTPKVQRATMNHQLLFWVSAYERCSPAKYYYFVALGTFQT